jgi:hypothetical protein
MATDSRTSVGCKEPAQSTREIGVRPASLANKFVFEYKQVGHAVA